MISYHFPVIVLSCYSGIDKGEQEYTQNLEIELTLEMNKKPEDIRCVEDTINYFEFVQAFMATFENKHFSLLENIASEINAFCRTRYPDLSRVTFKISKKLPLNTCKTIVFQGETTL